MLQKNMVLAIQLLYKNVKGKIATDDWKDQCCKG